MPVTAARIPWYYTPAVLIVAGCLVAIVNFGVRSSFGFFTAPISEAHQWPREIFSFALAVQNLLWGVATPIAGMLADRYGSARVLMVGAVVYSIGTLMMAFTDTPVMFTIGGGILVGIGIALSSFSIVMAALGRIVPPEKRSWAFGIATASGSLGQFIFAPLGAALISAYGWQHALTVLSLCILLIIPFALPLMVQNRTESKPSAGEADLTMRQALGMAFGHGSYWLLDFRLLRLRLPARLHHRASAALSGRARHLEGSCRHRHGLHRPVQRDRLLSVRSHRRQDGKAHSAGHHLSAALGCWSPPSSCCPSRPSPP